MPKLVTVADKRKHWHKVGITGTAAFFQVSKPTVFSWRDSGCPWDAEEKEFDLFQVHKWLLEREKKRPSKDQDLNKEKTRVEIERIEAQIDKLRANTIPADRHLDEMRTMALEFRAFAETAISRNYQEFVGLNTGEEAHAILKGFWTELLKKWGYVKPSTEKESEYGQGAEDESKPRRKAARAKKRALRKRPAANVCIKDN